MQLTTGADLRWQALDLTAALNTARLQQLKARLLGPGAAPALLAMSPGTASDGGPDSTVAGQAATMPEAMAWVGHDVERVRQKAGRRV